MTRVLALVAATACLATGGVAVAQAPAADTCTGLATAAEEIACLRGALQESRAAQTRGTAPQVQTPASPPPSAARQAPAIPAVTSKELGAEQVSVERRAPAETRPESVRLQGTATAIRTNHLGLVTLRLDNGQIWQQAEGRGVPLRLKADRTYPVEISPSGFGGYRMSFPDTGRQIVVTRLQ